MQVKLVVQSSKSNPDSKGGVSYQWYQPLLGSCRCFGGMWWRDSLWQA